MHSCIRVSGNTLSIAWGKPFSPSMHAINTSFTPRFFSSVSTPSQNLAPSLLLVQRPSTSLRPSRSTPMATYTARFSTRPSCRIFTFLQRIQIHDRVQRFQWPALPPFDFFHHRVGYIRDQRGAYFHSVHLLQMTLNLARRHPA